MTDRIRDSFETWAKSEGFTDLRYNFDRYSAPVVRWMWAAWKKQAENVNGLAAALNRAQARNAELVNQCRDHDTRRAAAVAQAASLAAEVERLTAAMDLIQKANPEFYIAQIHKGLTGSISIKNSDGSPFDVSNFIGAKMSFYHHPMSFIGRWIPVEAFPPDLGEDVLVTILIDGIDEAWHAGFWNGVSWFVLDTEHDEPIEVTAGCNFVVTHWTRVVTAGGRKEE